MRIKTDQSSSKTLVNKTGRLLRKRSKIKWLFMPLLLVGLMTGASIFGIYYGAKLQVEGKIHFLKRWGTTLVKKPFSIASNYVDGLKADPNIMSIDVKFENYQMIAFQRQLALEHGPAYRVHPANPGYVPAKLTYKNQESKIKIRLKGGQVEHFGHEYKWSFKIKMKGSNKVEGMKLFSVQQAKNRVYINEWILHKFLAYNDLIALNYSFIKLVVNGKDHGIYSLEENMGKQLIERNGRKEGPIINYNSDLRWDYTPGQAHQFFGGNVNAFNEKDILESVKLKKDFETARSLMEAFRLGKLSVKQVFDVEKLATFFAIIDLTGNQHATTLNNMKFYFNPLTSLIEPIGYDNGYFNPLPSEPLYGERIQMRLDSNTIITKTNWETPWYESLFTDKDFVKEYIGALEKLSHKEFLDNFFASIKEDFDANVQILRSGHPWYNHDGAYENPDNLYHNQDYIRRFLAPRKALQVYYDELKSDANTIHLQVSNIFNFPIELKGLTYNTSTDSLSSRLNENIIIQAYQGKGADFVEVQIPTPKNLEWTNEKLDSVMQYLKLDYKVFGTNGKLDDVIYPYIPKAPNFIQTDLMRQNPNPEEFDFLNIDDNLKTISIKAGNWNLNKNLIIPKGYTFVGGGREVINLDMTNNALILSYAPLTFTGTEDYPINIFSSDSTGQGIIVMKAKDRSELSFVNFDNLGRPDQGNYQLTGAVSFFESPVDFNTVRFANNRIGDDCLNTIRTNFTMEACTFYNTNSDAFDADFCTGTINNTFFIKSGNDAVDVSGAYLEINNIVIDSIGDKALSAGEDSKMVINGAKIKNTAMGVTSKDKSSVNINNVSMSNVEVAYCAFQKKPEFGSGYINATNSNLSNVKVDFLIEEKSRMLHNGAVVPIAEGQKVKDLLYGVKYGTASGPR